MKQENQTYEMKGFEPQKSLESSIVPPVLVPFPEKAKYLKDWKTLMRARFNAAKRYERKQNASILAFVVSGIFGFLVPFYVLLFEDILHQNIRNILEFTSYAIGTLSLILGLVEQARGYNEKQRKFHDCARSVNKVRRHLGTAAVSRNEELIPYIREYERIIDCCDENHDDIDSQIAFAQAQWDKADDNKRDDIEKKIRRLKRYETFSIYRIYLILLGLPLIIAIITMFLIML